MTTIASRILERSLALAGDARVADLRIGLGYTAALLSTGGLGLAYTFRREAAGGCTVDLAPRPLAGRSVPDLLTLLGSRNPIEAAIGLACSNALTNVPGRPHVQGDVLDHIDVRPDDDVAMVGRFGPLVEGLRSRARSLAIFERVDEPTGDVLPASRAAAHLAGCTIAVITATTILNHTIDDLLGAASACRAVAVLGASTPLVPDAFAGTPITLLSGVVARDPRAILAIVSEAGGMRVFKRHVRKVNVEVRR
jgi:uncharacterized protein (DUF4213/DUF364 family)